MPGRRADRLPDPGRHHRRRPPAGQADLGLGPNLLGRPDRRGVRRPAARVARTGGLAGPRVGRRAAGVGLERTLVVGDGTATAGRLGRRPVDRVPGPYREPTDADLRPAVHCGQSSARQRGPALPCGRGTAPGDPQRPATHRRGPRPRKRQLPALRRIPHVRPHPDAAQGWQHPGCATRQRARLRPSQRRQPRGRADRAVLLVAEPAQGQRRPRRRHAARGHRGAAGQRRQLPHRRNHQRRHRWWRRQPRIPRHHRHRHRRRRRHRHRVHPVAVQAAPRRRGGDRIGQQRRCHGSERRRRRHPASHRAAGNPLQRRPFRRRRLRPRLAHRPRPARHRRLVLGRRLRRAPRAARLGPARRRPVRDGETP